MSIARLVTVQKSRKSKKYGERKCEACRTIIPTGAPYRYFTVGFHSNFPHVRCLKATCSPKPSELESSQLSEAFSAQEIAIADLGWLSGQGEISDIQQILDDFADVLTSLSETYREADEAFGGGGATRSGEMADTLETASSELSDWSPSSDEPEFCDVHEDGASALELDPKFTLGSDLDLARDLCEDCLFLKESWWEDLITEARGVVEEASFTG